MYLKKRKKGVSLTSRQHEALEAWLATHVNPSTDLNDFMGRSYIVSEYQEAYKQNHWLDATAPLVDVPPLKFRDALRDGYSLIDETPQALNESFMDTWNNKITVFKAVTDNTVSLSITDDGADRPFSTGRLSNEHIDRLIDLLKRAKG